MQPKMNEATIYYYSCTPQEANQSDTKDFSKYITNYTPKNLGIKQAKVVESTTTAKPQRYKLVFDLTTQKCSDFRRSYMKVQKENSNVKLNKV